MDIRAAVARGPHTPMLLETLQIEAPRENEILVRVVATGICHTDIGMRDQHLPTPLPAVLGHEGAGVVERVGAAVTKVKPGDHVVMTYNSCGHCPSCFDGESTYCHEFFPRNFFGTRQDGSSGLSKNGEFVYGNIFGQSSFASHALCHERNIVKVPRDVPLELLGPLACGVQTGAGAVLNSLDVRPGKSLAVFGAGSVGLSAVMAARVAGATTIVAIDVHEERLDLARELGATHVFSANTPDLGEQILQINGGIGVDYAVDATGIPAVVEQAIRILAPRGCCAVVGAPKPGSTIQIDLLHLMGAGRQVRGVVEGDANPDVFIPALIRLYQQGLFPFDRLVRFYDFEQINQAVDDAERGRVLKAIVRQP
ncbi:NAD(P)-dependent alcohol dehydrogenase [Burkholderia sp. Bp9017]|uniref:NAD(P)-dependent alcohol dehydrogenase n=1 Tax=unclassified Burkholderia TaxID=2613784 RepID=UPI000F60305E|nr:MULTISPECIES: NAD(P)-dependent alcohol dehydrogenase [unclassified Burkholderia]RQZ31720.1 NAD(P)-dependent alcohol dehydrogenase [Burkholderia sp. Bp9017]RQZ37852.1 NAD(P)-dependent alcohol dehydrogenase [Burkholderia sp. Bp9016]